ncbi:redoxin domain-containing protein [Maribellus sp. YY47]|uniref:peroxiredoxin family protein n=1 Tax=Maribellus sp. YY47 TaxID=2929486 RepID=UPI0020014FF1|nr:redoxin domain-containing protein [Maribellus sp. YY47]MCK3684419.1 peroxiredoxin family protein [Maribellus sp. YY47]
MRNYFSVLLILLLFLFSKCLFAQHYKIEIELPNEAGKQVRLAYHFLDKLYAADTTVLDSKGAGIFEGDSLLTQGLYKILIDDEHHFDFLLGADQQFHLYNAGTNSAQMKIKGSEESEAFVNYLNFLETMKTQSRELNEQYKTVDENRKKEIREHLQNLNAEMRAYREKINHKLPGSFLYKFLIANEVPHLDTSTLPVEIQQSDSLLLLAKFRYQLEHYWDNFDYTDERMLYTPFYKPKLETWFTKVLYPAYDSVKPYVYQFLDNVESNPRIFQYAASYFINAAINSNILGMDALFVDLANDYYLNGKAFWASESTLDKVRENVIFLKDNLIGKTAPDLTLENFDGEYVDLHQIDAEITILIIYEPNCGHCKVFVPELYNEVYQSYKNKGLEVFAIYSMDNREEWTEFLTEHHLFDWINVWDEHQTTRFKILYDGRKTPGVYVLDHDKKIIAKKLDIEQLKQLLADTLK